MRNHPTAWLTQEVSSILFIINLSIRFVKYCGLYLAAYIITYTAIQPYIFSLINKIHSNRDLNISVFSQLGDHCVL